jgi:hypothetical protein
MNVFSGMGPSFQITEQFDKKKQQIPRRMLAASSLGMTNKKTRDGPMESTGPYNTKSKTKRKISGQPREASGRDLSYKFHKLKPVPPKRPNTYVAGAAEAKCPRGRIRA